MSRIREVVKKAISEVRETFYPISIKEKLDEKYDLSMLGIEVIKTDFGLNFSLKENISEVKKVSSELVVRIMATFLIGKFTNFDEGYVQKFGDLTVIIKIDKTAHGEYNPNTKTITVYLTKMDDFSNGIFENILIHEVSHYCMDKKATPGTLFKQQDDYYGSNSEFEPFVVYFFNVIENTLRSNNPPFTPPKNRRDYPKFIFKQIIPYIRKNKIGVFNDFLETLDNKRLARLYKMGIDYFAKGLEEGVLVNNIANWCAKAEMLEENKLGK